MKSFLTTVLLFFASIAYAQDATFDTPPLNRSEARILKAGILSFVTQYPDSTNSSIFLNLEKIAKFTQDTNQSISVQVFSGLPMEVISHVEKTYYAGSIAKWNAKSDYSTTSIETQRMMIKSSEQNLEKLLSDLSDKISFQCKYFLMVGMPCPE